MCSEGYCSWVCLSVCLSVPKLASQMFIHAKNSLRWLICSWLNNTCNTNQCKAVSFFLFSLRLLPTNLLYTSHYTRFSSMCTFSKIRIHACVAPRVLHFSAFIYDVHAYIGEGMYMYIMYICIQYIGSMCAILLTRLLHVHS